MTKKKMKGIIMAGGKGTRLYPLTLATHKTLLPVYDKPMIFYPLSVLMSAGIKDVLIISTPQDLPNFKKLFGNGENLGIKISYKEELEPKGSAMVFPLGEEFIAGDKVVVIYGDNIIVGENLPQLLSEAINSNNKATIFGFKVNDPHRFGVVEFDETGKVLSLEEKPAQPKSNYASIGLYVYDNRAVSFSKNVQLSERGELEITDVNKMYLEAGDLEVKLMGDGYHWLDTGTVGTLVEAHNLIQKLEEAGNKKIASLEEIAYVNGWISKAKLQEIATTNSKSAYGQYLLKILETK